MADKPPDNRTCERGTEAQQELPLCGDKGNLRLPPRPLPQGNSVKGSEPVIRDSSYLADLSGRVVRIDLY